LHDSIGFFSTIELAFQRLNWLFNDSIGFSMIHLAFFHASIGFFLIVTLCGDSVFKFHKVLIINSYIFYELPIKRKLKNVTH